MTFRELYQKYPDVLEQFDKYIDEGPVGSGWNDLIERFLYGVSEMGLDVKIGTLKEKFGGLRIYWDLKGASEAEHNRLFDLSSEVETESMTTCEQCGDRASAQLRASKPHFYWMKTLCDQCEAKTRCGK